MVGDQSHTAEGTVGRDTSLPSGPLKRGLPSTTAGLSSPRVVDKKKARGKEGPRSVENAEEDEDFQVDEASPSLRAMLKERLQKKKDKDENAVSDAETDNSVNAHYHDKSEEEILETGNSYDMWDGHLSGTSIWGSN